MTEGHKTKLKRAFPIFLTMIAVWLGLCIESTHENEVQDIEQDQMVSVTSTMAARGFDAHMTKSDLAEVLMQNGLAEFELSYITKGEGDQGFIRVLSSDPLYQSDEPFRDPNSWLSHNFGESGTETRTFEGGISKTNCYAPVKVKGETIGMYRLSTQRGKETWNWMSYWPWLLGAILLALYFVQSKLGLENHKQTISIDTKKALDSELRKKDTELKMLSLVAKKSQNLMLITDDKGVILWVNETYENRNNYSAEELNTFVGRHLPEVSKNLNIRTIIRNVVDFNKSVVYESECTSENGSIYHAMTTVTPVADKNGKVQKLLFVDTDISKLKVTEKENSAFRKMAELSAFPIFRITREGMITFQNEASKPLLAEWCEVPGRLNDRKCTLIQGVLDSCEPYSFDHSTGGCILTIQFHPNCDDQTLHVIATPKLEVKENIIVSNDKDDMFLS